MISFTKINDMIDRITRSGAATVKALGEIVARLNESDADIRKLQRMTPDDIGLGQVRDYAPSNLQQAQNAINNTSNMTPRRTRDYAETNIFGPMGEAFRDAKNRLP